MADHDHVGPERADVLRRVAEGLAFGGAAAGGIEGDDIGAQALGGHLEGEAGTGARLEEKVDDGLPPQSAGLVPALAQSAFETGGDGVNLPDFIGRKLLQREQMAAGPGHHATLCRRPGAGKARNGGCRARNRRERRIGLALEAGEPLPVRPNKPERWLSGR